MNFDWPWANGSISNFCRWYVCCLLHVYNTRWSQKAFIYICVFSLLFYNMLPVSSHFGSFCMALLQDDLRRLLFTFVCSPYSFIICSQSPLILAVYCMLIIPDDLRRLLFTFVCSPYYFIICSQSPLTLAVYCMLLL